MLKGIFQELPQYKIIVFSTSKDNTTQEENEINDAVIGLKRYISKETKEIKNNHVELNKSITIVKDFNYKIEG